MRVIFLLLTGVLLATSVGAETIDLGRGEVALSVPTGYDAAKPAPLIMLVHGYTSSGTGQDRYLKIGPLADEYGFFFLAPDGTLEASGDRNRFWNAQPVCCDFQASGVDDAGYLKRLIDEVSARYVIDPDRIYLIGHSNGGFMVHRMARDYPDTIAAITSLNGAAPLPLTGDRPARPVNILQIHGTRDKLNAYEGGEIYGVSYPGAQQTVAAWARFAWGATASMGSSEHLDLDSQLPGAETVVSQYADGHVALWTIEEGSHIPAFNDGVNRMVVEWLLAHPKGGR